MKDITHWHKRESNAHVGNLRHSLDLCAPEGKHIRAALAGKVVWLSTGFKTGKPTKAYTDKGNRIVIAHNNGEYTAYEHMKYGGVKVRVGQNVVKDQVIGLVGATGWAHAPHLHFEVFNRPDADLTEGTTLQISFKQLRKLRIKCVAGKKTRCVLA